MKISKTIEMHYCKCIFLRGDENGILTAHEIFVDIPERYMYKTGAKEEYVSRAHGIKPEAIFRIESVDEKRRVKFEMDLSAFIMAADKKED